VYILILDNYAP